MEKQLWIETDFFKNFKCKCGDCKHTCCSNWRISISKNEYFRLISLECSKKLADKIESAFIIPEYPSDDVYRQIVPNYLGYCPMLDEEGLCSIQRELGEDVLSEVCRSYPRSFKKVNSILQATCSNSCEAVVELLMKQDSLTFVTRDSKKEANIVINTNEDIIATQLMFTNIIKDRSLPLNTRLKKIVSYLNNNDKDIYNELDTYLQIAEFVNRFSVNSFEYRYFKQVLSSRYTLDENGLKLLKEDIKQFEAKYPDWMIYFENIIINHLYYSNIPYVDKRIKKEDCTEGICLLYALLRIICSACTIDKNTNEDLAVVIADMFHLIEHSPFYYNAHILIKDETALLNI